MAKLYEKDLLSEIYRLEGLFFKDEYVRVTGNLDIVKSNTVFKEKVFLGDGTIKEEIKVIASELENGLKIVQIMYPKDKGVYKVTTGEASCLITAQLQVARFSIKSYLNRVCTEEELVAIYKGFNPYLDNVQAFLTKLKESNLLFKEDGINFERVYKIGKVRLVAGLVLADNRCASKGYSVWNTTTGLY